MILSSLFGPNEQIYSMDESERLLSAFLLVCLFIYIPQQHVSVFGKRAQINILYAARREINAWVTERAAEV